MLQLYFQLDEVDGASDEFSKLHTVFQTGNWPDGDTSNITDGLLIVRIQQTFNRDEPCGNGTHLCSLDTDWSSDGVISFVCVFDVEYKNAVS